MKLRQVVITDMLRENLATHYVETPEGCWEWSRARNRAGYGLVRATSSTSAFLAHRAAWAVANGPIPEGFIVCHKCDNPPCINPSHLFLGTHGDNAADRDSKGRAGGPIARNRQKTHCPKGHPYAGENLAHYKGYRMCLTCKRANSLAYYHAKKGAAQ